jgi:divalent metal cation (Fe/Co/Zn/Cd) transporter
VAAIIAGGIVAFNGWRLLRPAVNELMDRTPGGEMIDSIQSLGS